MHAEYMHYMAVSIVHALCFTEMADRSREYATLRKSRERDREHDS